MCLEKFCFYNLAWIFKAINTEIIILSFIAAVSDFTAPFAASGLIWII